MDVRCKLAAAMGMAKEVSNDCEYRAKYLERDMESRAHDLGCGYLIMDALVRDVGATYPEDHARREDKAEGEDLNGDVHPQY